MTRLDKMIDKIKTSECRMTPQRLAILKILADSKEHPSVDHIYERVRKHFPTTSIATVYKTVTLLKELDEVIELDVCDGKYHYDGRNPIPHPHLICMKCKQITDSDISGIYGLTQELTRKTGYQIVSYRTEFFGICPDCQDKDK